jgi:hypothetical protein
VEKNVCHAPKENGKGNVFAVRHETKCTKTLYCAFFLDVRQREVFDMSPIKSVRYNLPHGKHYRAVHR